MRSFDLRAGVMAGFAGTVAMTTGYAVERALRRNVRGPLDYDDSMVPARAAANVLGWADPGPKASRLLGFAVHWGYGSLVGVGAVPLVRSQSAGMAVAGYWAGITLMASTLFPTLGGTPPPWRWRPDFIATSLGQHLVYAGVVVAVLRRSRPVRTGS
jgi:hypothetical protein